MSESDGAASDDPEAGLPPGLRPSQRPSRPTKQLDAAEVATRTTIQPGPKSPAPQLPLVIASTCDPGGLQRLSLRLYGRARVVPVRDTLELKRRARKNPGCVIVLDAAAPELDPLDAATALGVIEPRAVIVWGASPSMREELSSAPIAKTWMHVGLDTEPRALAELISSLL